MALFTADHKQQIQKKFLLSCFRLHCHLFQTGEKGRRRDKEKYLKEVLLISLTVTFREYMVGSLLMLVFGCGIANF